MTATSRRFLPPFLWGLVLMGLAVGGVLAFSASNAEPLVILMVVSIIGTFATVGLVLARRMPQHRMGWMFLAAGLLGAVWLSAIAYQETALTSDWPGLEVAVLLTQAFYFPWILSMVALPVLLFPDGRLPSPRWRWLGWVVAMAVVVSFVTPTLRLQLPVEDGGLVDNPLGIDALDPVLNSPFYNMLGVALLVVSLLGPVAALVHRFRRSVGVERQQLKWFAFAAAVAGSGLLVFYLVEAAMSEVPGWINNALFPVALLAVLGIPVATGLAIVRYRLYDIDRLISRTISYGILVGVLVAVYGGGVYLLGTLLPFEGNLAVALSTLAVAGLANPLRRRVQTAIDRRFYRSNYDAQREADRLSTRFQNQVDIDVLVTELLEAAEETMKPVGVGVWLRRTR